MATFSLSADWKHSGAKRAYDNRSFYDLLPCGATIFGVFDAHLGKEAAKYSCRFIQEYLRHNLEKCHDMRMDKVQQVLETSFCKCQMSMLVHKHAERFIASGASATVGIIIANALWLANVGDVKCVLCKKTTKGPSPLHDKGYQDDSLKTISVIDDLKNMNELIRIIEKGNGWYENDLVCNKIKVTRALGNLWQIGALGWQPSTNLRFLNLKALRENQATIATVKQVMQRKPITWCVEYHPHLHFEADLSIYSQIMVYSASLENAAKLSNIELDLFDDQVAFQSIKFEEKINDLVSQNRKSNLLHKIKLDNMTLLALKKRKESDECFGEGAPQSRSTSCQES